MIKSIQIVYQIDFPNSILPALNLSLHSPITAQPIFTFIFGKWIRTHHIHMCFGISCVLKGLSRFDYWGGIRFLWLDVGSDFFRYFLSRVEIDTHTLYICTSTYLHCHVWLLRFILFWWLTFVSQIWIYSTLRKYVIRAFVWWFFVHMFGGTWVGGSFVVTFVWDCGAYGLRLS